MTVARATGRVRAAAIQRVFLGLLVANLAVVGAKVVIGVTAGSLSVLGDGMHSSVDALNNVLFIALTRFAGGLPVEQAHAIADLVEQRLRNELHLDEVVVHIEPC